MTDFNTLLSAWLEKPESERDYMEGAKLLLQLNRNRHMYRNISAAPDRYRKQIEYQLRKFYNIRIKQATHKEVELMQAQVEGIVAVRRLNRPKADAPATKRGIRADHEQLPDNIKQLYTGNLDILHRMRALHSRLCVLSEAKDGTYCPDSDRYPYLKELIELDKTYRENWHKYDTFDIEKHRSTMELPADEQSKRALRLVNLNKGKYKKTPNEALRNYIRDNYAKIITPSGALTRELTELGIL